MERQSIGVEVLVWKYQTNNFIDFIFDMCYIFDGPRKHVDLLKQLLAVGNNPAIRAQDDPGIPRSKQTTSKRKKFESNDCNKTAKEVKRDVTGGRKLY